MPIRKPFPVYQREYLPRQFLHLLAMRARVGAVAGLVDFANKTLDLEPRGRSESQKKERWRKSKRLRETDTLRGKKARESHRGVGEDEQWNKPFPQGQTRVSEHFLPANHY